MLEPHKISHCKIQECIVRVCLWLLRRVNLTPTAGALMSSIHDGYHSTSAKAGPSITYCRFVGAGKFLDCADYGQFFG